MIEQELRTVAQRTADAAWIPEWAPWVVLSGLVSVGFLGGLGVLPLSRLELRALGGAAPSSTAQSAAAAAPGSAAAPVAAAAEPSIVASHLVVTHAQTLFGQHKKITRTREEARQRAEEARQRALKGEDFAKLALEYSDDVKVKETKGNLGSFRRKDPVKPFADAAFALKVGEVSPVVETNLGFHVIKRTE